MIAAPPTLPGKHFAVLVVALLASFPYGWRASASLLLGGGIQVVNLKALERSVASLLGLAAVKSRGPDTEPASRGLRLGAALLLQLRWGILMGVVAAILLTLPVEPIALLVGLSTAAAAALWHGFHVARPALPRGR